MKTIWKLQGAKSQFSRVVDKALNSGPQYVSRRGVETVVVVSVKDYNKLLPNKQNFKELLLNSPKINDDFEITRQKDFPRNINL